VSSCPSGAVPCRPVRLSCRRRRPVPPKSAWFVCKWFAPRLANHMRPRPRSSGSASRRMVGLRVPGRVMSGSPRSRTRFVVEPHVFIIRPDPCRGAQKGAGWQPRIPCSRSAKGHNPTCWAASGSQYVAERSAGVVRVCPAWGRGSSSWKWEPERRGRHPSLAHS
jgi:hypothetical protein